MRHWRRRIWAAIRPALATMYRAMAPTWLKRCVREKCIAQRDRQRLGPIRPPYEPSNSVMFITSNGVGMGHITRMLAVARKLPTELSPVILTLSKGYAKVSDVGVPIRYYPSVDASGSEPRLWNEEFARHLFQVMLEVRPFVVMFDGTWVYRGVTEVCRALGVHLVWMQRGCWRHEVDQRSPQRHQAGHVCDEVVIPGDYGCAELIDVGPGVDVHQINPVVLTGPEELLDRDSACAELGLDPSNRHVIINLGGGTLFDGRHAISTALEAVRDIGPSWIPVVTHSPLSEEGFDDQRLKVVSIYPIARFFHAFDFVIAAAGYNSVQEAIFLGLPAIFVPNDRTVTDDQVRRARNVAEAGLGLHVSSAQELRRAIATMATPRQHGFVGNTSCPAVTADGAAQAARIIAERWAIGHTAGTGWRAKT